jgi:hypothetical protein
VTNRRVLIQGALHLCGHHDGVLSLLGSRGDGIDTGVDKDESRNDLNLGDSPFV